MGLCEHNEVNKASCKVLHLDWYNRRPAYRLELLRADLKRGSWDSEIRILSYSKKGEGGDCLLCSALMKPQLEYCNQF